jgi:DNA-binding PucR family transcriptional regulator
VSPPAAPSELAPILDAVTSRLDADLDTLAGCIADQIHGEMPELGTHARVTARTLAAVRANLTGFIAFMHGGAIAGDVEVSPETADYAHAFVHRNIGLAEAIRCFRLGHEQLWRAWVAAVDGSEPPPELRSRLIEIGSESMFSYVDRTTVALVEEYQREQEHWNRSVEARRAETVAAILAGETIDLNAAGRQLGYDLRRWHIGLVLWEDRDAHEDGELVDLRRPAVELATTIAGSSNPLVLPAGATSMWAWLATDDRPDDKAIDAALRGTSRDAVSISVGEPAHGLDGFRTTHGSALLARRAMRLAGERPGRARRFRSLALISLLSADLEQMRRFVADELGELAADDDASIRLRATLHVYFDERSSAVRTGRRLGIHTNTVNYRIHRCEELIGHPLQERRGEIEAALRLKQTLADATFAAD